jgi:hypothetical protein
MKSKGKVHLPGETNRYVVQQAAGVLGANKKTPLMWLIAWTKITPLVVSCPGRHSSATGRVIKILLTP